MSILKQAAIAVKSWEKFKESPYDDGGGVWTIGWGFTYYPSGEAVKEGDPPMSLATANEFLGNLLSSLADNLYASCPFWSELEDCQKSTLISFSFNTGYFFGDGNHDTLDRALEEDRDAVPSALMLYVKQGDKTLLGLQRRRRSEGLTWQGIEASVAYTQCANWEADEEMPGRMAESLPSPKAKKSKSEKVDM
jgi:lysozyme